MKEVVYTGKRSLYVYAILAVLCISYLDMSTVFGLTLKWLLMLPVILSMFHAITILADIFICNETDFKTEKELFEWTFLSAWFFASLENTITALLLFFGL